MVFAIALLIINAVFNQYHYTPSRGGIQKEVIDRTLVSLNIGTLADEGSVFLKALSLSHLKHESYSRSLSSRQNMETSISLLSVI
jgi:hypothetical protein